MRYTSFIALLCLCPPAWPDECTSADAYTAETITAYLDSWKNVAMAFKQFGKCDDGSVAEGFSEAVARLLADHWQQLPTFVQIAQSNPGLEAFVLRHLDETINLPDAKKIAKLARDSCPNDARPLCRKIVAKLGSVGSVPSRGAT